MNTWVAWVYPLTSGLGAFLLFLIQPMAVKALLPVFGGSFMVWAVAMAFFQGLLFLGYSIVHGLFRREVSSRSLAIFYVFLLLACFRPLQISFTAETTGLSGFVFRELLLLVQSLGIPFLCLTLTSVTLQRFWSVIPGHIDRPPFFLYSASNAGSLGALLAFPFIIEPNCPLTSLIFYWNTGFLVWVCLMIACFPWGRIREIEFEVAGETVLEGVPDADGQDPQNTTKGSMDEAFLEGISPPKTSEIAPERRFPWFWMLPTLASSALLGATTNVLTLDVASMPLIWILPLATYLWSFVRAFQASRGVLERAADRFHLFLVFAFSLAMLDEGGFALPADLRIVLHLIALYLLCFACHAVLAAAAPADSRSLTRYYVYLGLGGWIGASVVAFLIPVLFRGLVEYPISIFLVSVAVWHDKFWEVESGDPFLLLRALGIFLLVGVIPAIAGQWMPGSVPFVITAATGAMIYSWVAMREAIYLEKNRCVTALIIMVSLLTLDHFGIAGFVRLVQRNYYGVYRVFDYEGIRHLQMGSTYHGHEALTGPDAGKPLMYYHPETVIGHFFNRSTPTWKKMGVLGLGAGVLASFGREGQNIDFFEIDPDGETIARKYFSYLGSSAAQITITIGDGRLFLRHQPQGKYDLLLMDAFSSDSIPMHLLTVEAIGEYLEKLVPDGLLLFHVSNRNLNLVPVLDANAKFLKLECQVGENLEPDQPPENGSVSRIQPTRWIAMGSAEGLKKHLAGLTDWKNPPPVRVNLRPWTDDFSNLLNALNIAY